MSGFGADQGAAATAVAVLRSPSERGKASPIRGGGRTAKRIRKREPGKVVAVRSSFSRRAWAASVRLVVGHGIATVFGVRVQVFGEGNRKGLLNHVGHFPKGRAFSFAPPIRKIPVTKSFVRLAANGKFDKRWRNCAKAKTTATVPPACQA